MNGSPRSSGRPMPGSSTPSNIYSVSPAQDALDFDERRRSTSGSVITKPPSILSGLRTLMMRPRSESLGAQYLKKTVRPLKKVQINGCHLDSVYDLREGGEEEDLYNDEWAFRRPRSNSSDFLILRKTSRPLSVDVVGLVDTTTDPYRQYMRVVDCYELAPSTGQIIALDSNMTVSYTHYWRLRRAFAVLCENSVGAGLVWDAKANKLSSIVTMTDFLRYLQTDSTEGCSADTETVASLLSGADLVCVSAEDKILTACELFTRQRVHRILVMEPGSSDVVFLLTIKRVLQAIHKQNRSLHFAQWLSLPVEESAVAVKKHILTMQWNETVAEAVRIMLEHTVSSIPILDDHKMPIDVLLKSDLAILLRDKQNLKETLQNTLVKTVLGSRPAAKFLSLTDPVGKLLDSLLVTRHTRCVFLVNKEGHPVACVSQSDVLSHLVLSDSPFQRPNKCSEPVPKIEPKMSTVVEPIDTPIQAS